MWVKRSRAFILHAPYARELLLAGIRKDAKNLYAIQQQGLAQLSAAVGDISKGVSDLTRATEEGFSKLTDVVAEGLSNVASIMEWGFEEIKWELQQQTTWIAQYRRDAEEP